MSIDYTKGHKHGDELYIFHSSHMPEEELPWLAMDIKKAYEIAKFYGYGGELPEDPFTLLEEYAVVIDDHHAIGYGKTKNDAVRNIGCRKDDT